MHGWIFKSKASDIVNVSFGLFLVFLTLFFYEKIEQAGHLILIYSSLVLFQIILIYVSRLNSFLILTRDILFPVISVLIIFDSLGLIVHKVNPQDIDYLLIRIDYFLFGYYPTIFLERILNPILTDILQIAYSTYYFLPILLGVVLKIKKREEEFQKSLFLILLCFYLSYIGYILFPALGPRYAIEHLHEKALEGFLFSENIQKILNLLEGIKRDAFPSGHTGIALLVLFLSLRYEKFLFWILLIPVILLIFATIYCRYHYAVDVIGGVFLTIVTIVIGELYYQFHRVRINGYSS
jgi:membrane-associated phospholipid phosphatase